MTKCKGCSMFTLLFPFLPDAFMSASDRENVTVCKKDGVENPDRHGKAGRILSCMYRIYECVLD